MTILAKKSYYYLILLMIINEMIGCTQKPIIVVNKPSKESTNRIENPPDSKINEIPKQSYDSNKLIENILRNEYEIWKNTRHVMGGSSLKGTDCSGFVKKIYKKIFNIELPRRVIDQANMNHGRHIDNQNELQAGDLVFFKQAPPWYPYHVGIYLSHKEFMHVSKSKGVTISRLDDPYHWKKYYWKAIRILIPYFR